MSNRRVDSPNSDGDSGSLKFTPVLSGQALEPRKCRAAVSRCLPLQQGIEFIVQGVAERGRIDAVRSFWVRECLGRTDFSYQPLFEGSEPVVPVQEI
jgi:hypothetical protein